MAEKRYVVTQALGRWVVIPAGGPSRLAQMFRSRENAVDVARDLVRNNPGSTFTVNE